ncbi:MAG: hypothetical protein ABJ111_04285, partial [Alphaproteobacteria bacterium]
MNETLIAGLVVGAAVIVAALLLVFFRRKGGTDAAILDDLKTRLEQLDGTQKAQGGQLTAILNAQSQASGELTRTLNERLTQGAESIQA